MHVEKYAFLLISTRSLAFPSTTDVTTDTERHLDFVAVAVFLFAHHTTVLTDSQTVFMPLTSSKLSPYDLPLHLAI